MSSLFKQINDMGAQQRQQIEDLRDSPAPSSVKQESSLVETATSEMTNASQPTREQASKPQKSVIQKSGTTVPEQGAVVPHLDNEKLLTIVRELAQLPTNSNGLNVRLSTQEAGDIDDFIHVTLRKHGLKGNHVSAAKLIRYAFRYLFRVHEAEFVAALKEALKVEDKLSI